MSAEKYNFELTATSRLNNVFFFLEDEDDSVLLRTNNKIKWTGNKLEVDVNENLELALVVLGRSDIEWSAKLDNISDPGNPKTIWSDRGKLGEEIRNKSIRQTSVGPR